MRVILFYFMTCSNSTTPTKTPASASKQLHPTSSQQVQSPTVDNLNDLPLSGSEKDVNETEAATERLGDEQTLPINSIDLSDEVSRCCKL